MANYISFHPKDHVELGEKLGGIDFDSAVKLSGARVVVLKDTPIPINPGTVDSFPFNVKTSAL